VAEALHALNAATPEQARAMLVSCCGSVRWVDAMLSARPFSSVEALHEAAQKFWRNLSREDLLEAMSHHPRIGERAGASQSDLREQAGAMSADDQIKVAMVEGNRAYEARFGHIYLVCATGKSGAELLAILQSRLQNDLATELAVAAAEQEKITALRLDKLKGQP
jgi:2-oxo-4-hydroxy-4-carboxy-5-ureidoimidazoline decarboxylase